MKKKIAGMLLLTMLFSALVYAITLTGTFETAQDASEYLLLGEGDTASFSLLPDEPTIGFIGTIRLEKTRSKMFFDTIQTFTGTLADAITEEETGTYKNDSLFPVLIRLRLDSIDDDNTSATVDYTLAEVANTIPYAQIVKGIVETKDNLTLMRFTESGVEIPTLITDTFSSDLLIIPGVTVPAQTAEGSAVWDTDGDLLTIGTGSTRKTVVDTNSTQSLSGKTLVNPVISGGTISDVTMTIRSIRNYSVGAKVGATSGWAIGGAANTFLAANLPAENTGSTLVFPINGVPVGSDISEFNLIGQIESGGLTAVLGASLFRATAAASDVTFTNLGDMTTLSVTADTTVNAANTNKVLSSSYTATQNDTFYLLINATTQQLTDIVLTGVSLTVDESYSGGE